MAVTDGIIYRLKPEAGDAAPHNEIGGGHILTGGTITLVDRGSGDLAWQFAGGEASVAGPSAVYTPTAAEGGLTMLVTLKVVTNPTVDFTRYAQIQKVGDTNTYLGFGQNAANNIRSRFTAGSGVGSSFTGVGATETTLVIRVKTAGAGVEVSDTWKKTAGRSGTTPDGTQAFAAGASSLATLSTLVAGGGASSVVQIKDWVIWQGEKTDAECAALADNARLTLDVSADPSATLSWTEESDTSSITANVAVTNVTGTIAWTEASDTSASTATVASSTGTITTTAFKNNTGTILASLTGLTVTVLNLSTMAFVKTFTAQTTDASGVMTLNDALLVAGTEYAVVTTNAAKTLGVEKYTAT